MSVSEHEANYTPSKWSKRYGETEILARFFKLAGEVTRDARKSTNCELDIPYGKSKMTNYDIYGSDLPDGAPILVFIHGGYWQEGSKELAGFAIPVFVMGGIKVITVGYDLCPHVTLADIVAQIKIATEEILKSALNSGCRSVWIAGHSAGAHLAASLLFDQLWLDKMKKEKYLDVLKGMVLIAGVYNLKPLLTTTFNDLLKLSKEEVEKYSISTLDVKNNESLKGLKVMVTVGECDSPAFINESRELVQKLVTMVDDVQYLLVRENVDHFDIVERLTDMQFILTKLLLDNINFE